MVNKSESAKYCETGRYREKRLPLQGDKTMTSSAHETKETTLRRTSPQQQAVKNEVKTEPRPSGRWLEDANQGGFSKPGETGWKKS